MQNGILVFFSSYQQLKSHRICYQNNPQLKFSRPLFFESRKNKTEKTWRAFKTAAQRKPGAVLFCVFRGKFSEGFDFKNELCRLTVIIGVPYQNLQSPKIQSKQFYHKSSPARFREYYLRDAMTKVNQGIGRVRRHRADFGGVLLVDGRYAEEKYRGELNGYVRQLMQQPGSWKDALK